MFKPFTAQFGDNTYQGEWSLEGDMVAVRCPYGVRSRALKRPPQGLLGALNVLALAFGFAPIVGAGANPLAIAERLLIEILIDAKQI